MKERIRYIDIAKGIGIMMVTYGHITEIGNPVDQYMALFKITIFYFVSGYLMSYLGKGEGTDTKQYITSVFKHLGLPYIFFSMAAIAVRLVQAVLQYKSISATFMYNFKLSVTLQGIATLWFLPTIFFAQIILFLIVRNIGTKAGKAVLISVFFWPAVILIAWERFSPEMGIASVAAKSLVAVWFMAAGYAYHRYINGRLSENVRFVLGVILSVFTLLLTNYSHHIDFNMMEFGDIPALFFIGGITGSLGLLLVLEKIDHYYSSEILHYFGVNSLILMCSQRGLLFLNVIMTGFGKVFKLTKVVCKRFYFERLLILILLLIMVYGLTELINHCKKKWIMKKPA